MKTMKNMNTFSGLPVDVALTRMISGTFLTTFYILWCSCIIYLKKKMWLFDHILQKNIRQ